MSRTRPLPPPWLAVVSYTLRACLPPRRWAGVLVPAAVAPLMGWVATQMQGDPSEAFAQVTRDGLLGLVLPLCCLVAGDAVMGAEVRAGTFPLTWLSPVRLGVVVAGRWLGGWLAVVSVLAPAFLAAALIAGEPGAVPALLVAMLGGAAAYIALMVLLGVVTQRSILWALVLVFLGEGLAGTQIDGVAQVSPLWLAWQGFAGLWGDGDVVELRSGVPEGGSALVRLVLLTVVVLAAAAWRARAMRPVASADD